MTFTKLSDESKELIEQYKKQYGNENVGSYRALLMRGQSHDDCMKIINNRKQIKPIETKKQEAQVFQPATTEKPKAKRQPKKAKVEAPEVLAIENTKEPEPAPPAPKAKGRATKKKKNDDNTVELIL